MLNLLNSFSIVALSLHISLFDIRFHRIRNRSLALLGGLLLFYPNFLALTDALLLIVAVSIFCIAAKIGMGDLKMLIVLISLQGQILAQSQWLPLFSLSALLSIIVERVQKGGIAGEIPLAPAILFPFVAIYLGF